MSALPSQVNYNEPLLRLPENTTNFLACALPTNGSTFGPGSIAQVDLQTNRGFLDPASISIRYKVNVTSSANPATPTVAKLVGTPVYTFINKYVCYANSQTIETISNYNTVANLLVNLKMSVAQKLGQQYSFGYVGEDSSNVPITPVNNEQLDGRTLTNASEIKSPAPTKNIYTKKTIGSTVYEKIKDWSDGDDPDSRKWLEMMIWGVML
jgi:hypothetical protein